MRGQNEVWRPPGWVGGGGAGECGQTVEGSLRLLQWTLKRFFIDITHSPYYKYR